MDKFPIVRVTWVDAVSSSSWTDITEINNKCPQIVTVGYLVSDSPEGLTLAMQLDPDNDAASMTMVIPNHWVVSLDALLG